MKFPKKSGHFFGTLLFKLNYVLAETYWYNKSGRQDSNLRPSAPKALNCSNAALGFQAIANLLPDSS